MTSTKRSKTQTAEPVYPQKEILALFERPEQFLDWLGQQHPNETAAESLNEEARDPGRRTIRDVLTLYVQQSVNVPRSHRFSSSFGEPRFGNPSADPVVNLPSWIGDMLSDMPAVVFDPAPYYKTHKAMTEYIARIRAEESAAT